MENAQTLTIASFTACSLYVAYVYIYRSHRLLKTNVLDNRKLPSFAYLYIKYLIKAATRRAGCLYNAPTTKSDVIYTVHNCRLESTLLRRFCSVAGYGWDYPDTDYRDIPLCFPEFLCGRLLLMVLTNENFRLSPAGLVCVRQTLKTLEPVDELKKGPFMLRAQVLEHRQTDAGVEVDVCLSATSRTGSSVWESVLTLLSKKKPHKDTTQTENESQPDKPGPEDAREVELKVPRNTGLHCVRYFNFSPCLLLSLPAMLFGYRLRLSPSLWMLSVCLAEVEKHKGVEVITAPISITAQFEEPLLVPGKVMIRFWETTVNGGQGSVQGLSFRMQQHGSNVSHVKGLISKSST